MKKFTVKPKQPITASINFTCPQCGNATLYDVDTDLANQAQVGYHDRFICDECASEFLGEPQYDGRVKFIEFNEEW
jgi:predicted RNA-binding Zn-ribbon protein involved in translation (DUF1610 family)